MPKVKVPWLCSRSQPGIKVIKRDLRGHLLHTVTFLVFFFFFVILDLTVSRDRTFVPIRIRGIEAEVV